MKPGLHPTPLPARPAPPGPPPRAQPPLTAHGQAGTSSGSGIDPAITSGDDIPGNLPGRAGIEFQVETDPSGALLRLMGIWGNGIRYALLAIDLPQPLRSSFNLTWQIRRGAESAITPGQTASRQPSELVPQWFIGEKRT